MKNLFVALITLAMGSALHAQSVNRVFVEVNRPFNAAMDKAGMNSSNKTLHTIHIRAVRSFKQTYKNIDNETWFAIPNGYRARFVENGIRHDVTYDKKGVWLYTIRQYNEDKLARDVRAQVKAVYYDYSIILVEEIIRPQQPLVHVIHMEDAHTFRNVQICEREMATVLDIQKS